jgi:cytochrome c oxidase subunit 2
VTEKDGTENRGDRTRPKGDKDWGAGKFIAAALVVGLVVGALAMFLIGAGGVNEEKAKVFQLDAFHWGYSQDVIEVNQGDLVVIALRSAASNHELHEEYEEMEHEYMHENDIDEHEWEEELENDTSLAVHGFRLDAFGIEVDMPLDALDNIVLVKFVADKTGTFTFRCSNECGPGHDDMKGTLVVN